MDVSATRPTRLGHFGSRPLFSTNHNDIGTLCLIFLVVAGLFGTLVPFLIRFEAQRPGLQLFRDTDAYNAVVSAHGLVMIFFVLMLALISGFGNWFAPLHFGAPDVADPSSARPFDATLRRIGAQEAYRSQAAFLTEAKASYEAIIAASAAGSIDSVAHLITPGIRDDFQRHVLARKQRGETEETIFIGFRAAEIVDAAVDGNLVWIEVRFLADMVSATRDASGRVIAGDSIHVTQCAELWTFELQARQKRSAWLLSATESDETAP